MATIEQEYTLRILRDFLHEKPTARENVDWNALYAIAKGQQLEAIFYHQTKKSLFEKPFLQQVSRSVRIEEQTGKLKKALEGYDFFFLKGAWLKALYPVPALRSMGDVDLMVRKADEEEIQKRLEEAGFTYEKSWEEQSVYYRNQVCFEVHNRLVLSRERHDAREAFSAGVWDYVQGHELDINYHFIYVLFHLRKHLRGHGVGLRQFMDVAVLSRKVDLDWAWIVAQLEKLDALTFLKRVLAFNERAFGVKVPEEAGRIIGIEPLEEEFYQKALARIFAGGVFGKGVPESVSRQIARIMQGEKVGIAKAKRVYLRNRLFPSYEQIKGYSYLRYLRNGRVLLPLAWVHRWIYALCHKKIGPGLKEAAAVEDQDIREQTEISAKWGL